MTSRRALLRHLWAMFQTRVEAAGLVLSLQRSALGRGLAWYAVAGIAAIALLFSLVLLVALGTPEQYRVAALGALALALLAGVVLCALQAKRQIARDTALIADFTGGLRLDLAMVNLALKDPEPADADSIDRREQAQEAVREAAAEQAATPVAAPAATPAATEMELRAGMVTPPEELTTAAGTPATLEGSSGAPESAPPTLNGAAGRHPDAARPTHGTP